MAGAARMLVALMGWLSRRSLATVHRLGALLGAAAYWASPGYRRKIVANLSQAGLDAPRMRRAAARHAGMLATESAHVWLHPIDRIAAKVEVPDWSAVEQARARNRGILFLTPHLGAFEVTARRFAREAPITVLYKPPRHASLRALVERARPHANLRTAPATLSGVRALLKALRRGEAVGILPDQVPGEGEGAWAPFFGRPAFTMTLPERLARATGCAVLLAAGERLPGRGWRLHFDALAEPPTPAVVNAAMERLVRRFPEQYLWSYNRYKRPAGAPSPEGVAR